MNSSSSQTNIVTEENNTLPTLTRSSRKVKPLGYLQDYHCGLISCTSSDVDSKASTAHPISQVINYDKLGYEFKAAMLVVTSISEPSTYNQAYGISEWEHAMADELKAFGS